MNDRDRVALSDRVIADQGERLYRRADELEDLRRIWRAVGDSVLGYVMVEMTSGRRPDRAHIESEISRASLRSRELIAPMLKAEIKSTDAEIRAELYSALPHPTTESRIQEEDFGAKLRLVNQIAARLGEPTFSDDQAEELAFEEFEGEVWDERLQKFGADTARDILRSIGRAFAGGESVDDLARELRGTVDGNEYRARMIARTELARVAGSAKEKALDTFGDVVAGEELVAAWENTCPECGALDGRVFKRSDPNRPTLPIHPNCACTYAPVARTWRELGIDMDEIEPPGRAIAGGTFIRGRTTWRQWIKTQPAPVQRQVFGAGRFDLLNSGKVSIDDMPAPGGGGVRTLKALKRVASR